MGSKFRGLGVAMVTPFNEDGSVDFLGLSNLTNHLIDGGVDYLVVMGTTGENPTISKDEQLDILHKVQEVNNGKLPIVFGIGGNNTQAIVDQIKSMNFDGVDGILSVSPYYSKPNQEGIYQHYKSISEVSPVPVIIYNVPGRTGSTISPETTLRIADLPNMHATKEASGSFDIVMNILRNKKDNFHVFSGDDDLTLPFISVGMEGVISVIGNAYPSLFSRMVHLALEGKMEEAREIHYQLLPMIKAIFMDGNPPGVKYLLSKMGICKNEFRLPVHPVNEQTAKAIDKAFI
ncbi:4-hydroxy-tetrahydrodipicolinate synthase [bacterium]|nr:4-hydroxy-tetrahydrodipicolinate synthase [bacterium]